MEAVDIRREWVKCSLSPHYFIHEYCYIYDAVLAEWVPFKLWEGQASTLSEIERNLLIIILKARQLGQTWLVLSFALWLMIFHPAVTILLFSRRDDEAQYLLERVRGIYDRLPDWCKVRRIPISNNHEWQFSNGSVAYAFPTTAGDSYTASMAIVDEADLVPNLDFLMNAVKPTIDNGGRMILLSRSNKEEPQSPFKRMYRAAKAGLSNWKAVFLPWWVHPSRDRKWYEDQERDSIARTGSVDDLWQQYPETDIQALSPRMMDKRIPSIWLEKCYVALTHDENLGPATLHPKLKVYREPEEHHTYVIGADPAEGNPTSDPSAITVLDAVTMEEAASFNDRIEPSLFGELVINLARTYNSGGVLVERNNHGHVVLKVLRDDPEKKFAILLGLDGLQGWHTNAKSKSDAYSTAADCFRDSMTLLHTEDTFFQLSAVEGSTLKAPTGEHDDLAVSYVLALQAAMSPVYETIVYNYLPDRLSQSRLEKEVSRPEL